MIGAGEIFVSVIMFKFQIESKIASSVLHFSDVAKKKLPLHSAEVTI